MKKVILISDAVCRNNIGGYASVLKYTDKAKIEHSRLIQGKAEDVTNQRISLLAIVDTVSQIKFPCEVEIKTDSEYVVKGINQYLQSWKSNGWKRSNGQAVANVDLWLQLSTLTDTHQVTAVRQPSSKRLEQLAQAAIA